MHLPLAPSPVRDRPSKLKEVSTRTLTSYYLLALLVVAGLSIVCHFVLARELHLGKSSAALINLSGRQRMLSQRIAGMAAQYRLGEPGAHDELIAAINAFEQGHQRLLAEIDGSTSSNSETRHLRSIYRNGPESLDIQTRNYIVLARRIAATSASDPVLPALLTDLFAQARYPLLRDLDAVVAVRQQESEIRLARLRHIQNGILATVLITLVVEAFTIFRPMVSRIIRYTERLITLASTDPLTGVANRRSFIDSGNREVARAQRHARPLSLLIVDVDHFKQINDTRGHATGDNVLVGLSSVLAQGLRSADILGRIGGEEFAILLPETSIAHALQVAERLRIDIAAARLHYDETAIELTISIGVAGISDTTSTISDVMIEADQALYQAKETGRNRVVATLACIP